MRNTNSPAINYIRNLFGQEDEYLAQIGNDLQGNARKMQIAPDEGKMLHMLVKMAGAKKIIELGVLAGYSTIWMARALPEDGMIYAIERDKQRIEPCRQNFIKCGVDKKIKLLNGDAINVLNDIEKEGPFDMIFIDADKAGYSKYLDWAEQNIRKGGLIVGDNTLLFGYVYKEKNELSEHITEKSWLAMREFNQRLSDAAKYTSVIIPTLEGMTVAIKDF